MLRAPRKGTLIVSAILYLFGLFGALGWLTVPPKYAIAALAIAGALLILGSLLQEL
jgi:hypothetical protein